MDLDDGNIGRRDAAEATGLPQRERAKLCQLFFRLKSQVRNGVIVQRLGKFDIFKIAKRGDLFFLTSGVAIVFRIDHHCVHDLTGQAGSHNTRVFGYAKRQGMLGLFDALP